MNLQEINESLANWRRTGVDFSETSLSGNTDVIVSHSFSVPPILRKKGIGREVNNLRLQKWKAEGRAYVICTVRLDNIPELKILKKNGWVELTQFTNECEEQIAIYGKNLLSVTT